MPMLDLLFDTIPLALLAHWSIIILQYTLIFAAYIGILLAFVYGFLWISHAVALLTHVPQKLVVAFQKPRQMPNEQNAKYDQFDGIGCNIRP